MHHDKEAFRRRGAVLCRLYRYLLWRADDRLYLVDIGDDTGHYRIVRRVYSHSEEPAQVVDDDLIHLEDIGDDTGNYRIALSPKKPAEMVKGEKNKHEKNLH